MIDYYIEKENTTSKKQPSVIVHLIVAFKEYMNITYRCDITAKTTFGRKTMLALILSIGWNESSEIVLHVSVSEGYLLSVIKK